MAAPSAPRAEAEVLAGPLPAILLEARRLAAAAPGVHGRRRAGQGEAFWQFRDHRPEDGARLVDWRRSARGDRLYVREREREAAQTASFWIDPDPGFAWASDEKLPTKARRALTLALAFALLAARGGERVGALGGPGPRFGPRAVDWLARDLAHAAPEEPPPPPSASVALYFSDFYAPASLWRDRLKRAAARGANGALVMICDPAEEDFPFFGRTRFERPGGRGETLTFGRAEAAREAFSERLAAHRAEVREAARVNGFMTVACRTDQSAAPVLAGLVTGLEERR